MTDTPHWILQRNDRKKTKQNKTSEYEEATVEKF